MIEITDLSFGYKKDKEVLKDINLKIKERRDARDCSEKMAQVSLP